MPRSNGRRSQRTIVSAGNTFAAGTWLSYNVTSLVTASGQVAFMYTKGTAGRVTIASREDAAHVPQLIVTR